MECREARRLIEGYLAGEVVDIDALKEHIKGCERCNRRYEEALEMESVLVNALSPMTVSPAEEVMRRIKRTHLPRRWRRTFLLLFLIVFVSAALMLLAYYGTALLRRMEAKHELGRIKDAVEEHLAKRQSLPESETEAVWAAVAEKEWVVKHRLDDENRLYLDVWGNPYRLLRKEDFYLIVSSGPNGRYEFGSGDDFALRIKTE